MKQATAFKLDLRHTPVPLIPPRVIPGFAGSTLPSSGFDRKRGLRFPLPPGSALIYPGDGRISDAEGAIRVTFSLDDGDTGGQLLDSWAGYLRLSALKSGGQMEIELFAYGHFLRLRVPCVCNTPYTLGIDWDCRKGMSMSLWQGRRHLRMTGRHVEWHAYRQKYIPIAIGGKLADTRPRCRIWLGTFAGWISTVSCCLHPIVEPRATPLAEIAAGVAAPVKVPSLSIPPAVKLVELHDPPIHESPLRFDIIPDRLPNLRACRKLHPELEDHYHSAPNAFEGLRSVGRYVGNLWPHTFYWPWPREIFTDPGDRLLTGIKQGQVAGMCGGFAHAMEEALWALGIPARRTQVWHHSSLEAYDHHHDKWICLEIDNHVGHAGCWLAPDDTPYCIGELIDLLERDRHEPGMAYRMIRFQPLGTAFPSGEDNGPPPFSWLRFCYVLMAYARCRDDGGTTPGLEYHYATPAVRLDPANPQDANAAQKQVDDWRDLYWSCDRLQVRTTWIKARQVLDVTATPFQAQFFNGCEMRVDGGKPRCIGTTCEWALHPGENRLELVALNKLGRRGHPWRCTLLLPGGK